MFCSEDHLKAILTLGIFGINSLLEPVFSQSLPLGVNLMVIVVLDLMSTFIYSHKNRFSVSQNEMPTQNITQTCNN